jgi:cell wall-associated NlpC family hydrolase
MSDCLDLVGLRYRLGADGTDGEIDCIHLVYEVLRRLDIATPRFRPEWYEATPRIIARDLVRWGKRIAVPAYDGDVLLLRQQRTAFGVTWQTGILYINHQLERVAWCPVSAVTAYHCFRSRGS